MDIASVGSHASTEILDEPNQARVGSGSTGDTVNDSGEWVCLYINAERVVHVYPSEMQYACMCTF